MRLFGWLAPVQVTPTELMVQVCLWLAAGMSFSAAVAWLVLDLLALPAFTEHSPIIVLLLLLWVITLITLWIVFERMKSGQAIMALALLSLINGLLAASLFPLTVCLLLYGVIGGMFLLSALLARFANSRLRAGHYYWLMALAGCALAAAANMLLNSGFLEWVATLFLVTLFSLVSAHKSQSILLSARQLYSQQFVTVRDCASRGALAIWLGSITAFFDLLECICVMLSGSISH